MLNAFMILVCVLVLLQIGFFLVLVTGELTLWLKHRIGEAYRNSKRHSEAVRIFASAVPKM